jgi:hypothetical protein
MHFEFSTICYSYKVASLVTGNGACFRSALDLGHSFSLPIQSTYPGDPGHGSAERLYPLKPKNPI